MLLLCGRYLTKINKKEEKSQPEKTHNNLGLPLQACIPQYSCNYHKGEAPYITSKRNGSVTLEAALIMPMVILAFVSILQIMLMMNVQLSVQFSLYRQALKTSGYSYLADTVESYFFDELDTEEYGELVTVAENGITELLMKQLVLADLGEDFWGMSWIKDGESGMYTIITPWVSEGVIDVIIYYELEPVFNFFGIDSIPMTARVRYGKWTGVTKAANQTDSADAGTVYITKNGTVYHTYRDCTYIRINLTTTSCLQVSELRNQSGGKYYKCTSCCTSLSQGTTVYVSKYGDKYHQDKQCSRIYRNVIEISLEEVGDKTLCSKCRGRGGSKDDD